MTAYYNEFDPYAAEWLRELIKDNQIAPGIVDERSITEIQPSELEGFTQCHFFAGVGVWSYALRSAGWPDTRPIWTGSCPCQPFSAAGIRKGTDDERHLLPAFVRLIEARRPSIVVGEQVASPDVIGKVKYSHEGANSRAWLDLVHTYMEDAHYACGSIVTPSAGVGAPHIRQRSWWLAYCERERLQGRLPGRAHEEREAFHGHAGRGGTAGRLANSESERRNGLEDTAEPTRRDGAEDRRNDGGLGNASCQSSQCKPRELQETQNEASRKRRADGHDDNGYSDAGEAIGLEHPNSDGFNARSSTATTARHRPPIGPAGGDRRSGPTNGRWSDVDWLFCRDGKWRPVEPGASTLVDGVAEDMVHSGDQCPSIQAEKTNEARAMRLKGYGNAINADSAIQFVSCVLDVLDENESIR